MLSPRLLEAFSLHPGLSHFFEEPVFTLSSREWEEIVTLIRTWHTLGYRQEFQEAARGFLREAEILCPPHPFDPTGIFNTFDFHRDGDRFFLIEMNTNGGGFLLALLAWAASEKNQQERILMWGKDLFRTLIAREQQRLRSESTVFIVDEDPLKEFLYPEMWTFSAWLGNGEGSASSHLYSLRELLQCFSSPSTHLSLTPSHSHLPLIYNRLTDFYLTGPECRSLRKLWEESSLCLTPSPVTYALQADKRLFLVAQKLGIPGIPETYPLRLWQESYDFSSRKDWVFKPLRGYGSRGVYLGRKLSYSRYQTLDPDEYIVQRYIPPIKFSHPTFGELKADLRVFTYAGEPILFALRGFRSQVMGFQEEGSGFYPVHCEGLNPWNCGGV